MGGRLLFVLGYGFVGHVALFFVCWSFLSEPNRVHPRLLMSALPWAAVPVFFALLPTFLVTVLGSLWLDHREKKKEEKEKAEKAKKRGRRPPEPRSAAHRGSPRRRR